MSRPTFEDIYMNLAHTISKRSTCKRLQVGCVLTSVDYRKVLSLGYNGNATGLDHDECDELAVGNCGCLHGESNAIINCDVPRYVPKIVFVTHLPCLMCAKQIVNLGNVQKVYYASEYRTDHSKEIFSKTNIPIQLHNVDVPPLFKVPSVCDPVS